jgi:RNA polymerase sigma factor (sigma-70 family)
MLGSLAEADDAVQETWLRLGRSDASAIENLGGWLTTVVSRVCLNVLRSRVRRGETQLDAHPPDSVASHESGLDPEEEAILADGVGLAMLVVLDTLNPAERLAFVLHDLFAVTFEEIGTVVGRSPAAARQLASRARRRVRGTPAVPTSDLERQHQVVEAFLAASRHGDFDALVAVLDPEVELRADETAIARGAAGLLRGPAAVAAASLVHRARVARTALVNGEVGVVVAPSTTSSSCCARWFGATRSSPSRSWPTPTPCVSSILPCLRTDPRAPRPGTRAAKESPGPGPIVRK